MINYYNLQRVISEKIPESVLSLEDALSISKSIRSIGGIPIETVADLASLPTASSNMGYLFYVESTGLVYYSTGDNWSELTPASGVLWTWGSNQIGQLGTNNTASRSSPGTTISGGTNWSQISGGTSNAIAIKTDGTLWSWGYNNNGQLGDGTTADRSSPGTTAGGGTNWSQVDIQSDHALAIKTDGTLWTWGNNGYGRLGDGTTTSRRSPGTTIAGGTNWSQVDAGAAHSAAIKTDGTLWTWGTNAYGKLGNGTTADRSSPGTTAGGGTNWSQVSAGGNHTIAIKTNSTLWTWGLNSSGQLGDGTTTSRLSPSTTAGGGTNWSQVSAGDSHSAAIKTDGTLWTWGTNYFTQLGNGTNNTTSRSSPGTTAGGGTNWSQVNAGNNHTAAIKTDGTLWTWGFNSSGQLGDGTTTDRSSPVTTIGGSATNWSQVTTGSSHTISIGINY